MTVLINSLLNAGIFRDSENYLSSKYGERSVGRSAARAAIGNYLD